MSQIRNGHKLMMQISEPKVFIGRLERAMDARTWRAFMAGRHAARRDDDLARARRATDPIMRAMHIRNAREEHHYYLKSARLIQRL